MPAKDDPADYRAGRWVAPAEIEPARWRGAVAGCRAGRYSVSTLLISAIIGGNLVFLLMLYLGARRLGMLFDSGLSDFSMDNGRIFVCGDIHGCIEPLLASLDAVGFDKERDHLYALGNLVDWGPASPAVLALLDEPWFSSTLGYHEMLLLDAATGNYHQHARNGGVWFAWRSPEERAACVAKVKALPVAITVITPSGRSVGLVHADVAGDDWTRFSNRLEEPEIRASALTVGERAKIAKQGGTFKPIRNIDHVYVGRTAADEPLSVANMSWIPTECLSTGRILIEELV